MKAAIRSMIAESAGAAGPLLALEGAAELQEPAWQDFALCAEVDPDLFFPEQGEPNSAAKKICRGCPVRGECLEYSLSLDEDPDGIWGGYSLWERRRMRRTNTTSAPVPLVTVTEKYCARCGTTKGAGEFWKNRSTLSGLGTYCISCELGRRERVA